MATVLLRRSARRPAPEMPTGELRVAPPPEIPQVVGARWQQLMVVLPMLGGGVAMAMLMGRGGGPFAYVVGALFGVSSLAMLASWGGAGAPKKAEMLAARRDYLRHLAGLRRRARETVARQRAGLAYRHPEPGQVWSTVASHRLWERRATDPDFAVVRVGAGPQALATPLVPPVTGTPGELEPMTAGALRRFLDAYSVVPDLPVALSLRGFARIHLRGEASALARAMVVQLSVFHAPDDLRIAVCAGPERRGSWEWVKWLPHAQHPSRTDALGPVRLVAASGAELDRLLGDVVGSRSRFAGGPARDGPHVVVVLDGAAWSQDGGIDGVSFLDLDGTPPRLLDPSTLVLSVGERGVLLVDSGDGPAEVGRADGLTAIEAEAVARRLAPWRLAAPADAEEPPVTAEPALAELLGLGDLDTAPPPRAARDRLRVPIGVTPAGRPVELDLKESAQDGMGPHGLLVGATGSGKSELLRTLVLGLAATHSSEELNFVLVDYKGGATFAALDRLPHTAAVITNLADELPLVDRMTDALNGEIVRRQELLRRAGASSIREYAKARTPLPYLLIVCDEFAELLAAKPDFIELFLQIGRLGRSLGVHLLLASQRLEEGRLRGLDTHLSYRIGLRTFSALESRSVLGVPDAYELPRSPGHGFLKAGTEQLVRFKAAYVSGPFRRPGDRLPVPRAGRPRVLPFGTHYVPAPNPATPPAEDGPSLLDLLVERLGGQGPPAHRVWLPPLSRPPALDELLGSVASDPARGLTVVNPDLRGALQVPVAVIDNPFEQRRDVLWLTLDGAAGHVAVAGGPQSGKSTLLRTLVCGLALTHSPAEARVYCLDFGGGSLATLRDLPHVGGVAGRLDAEAVRRTVGDVAALLADREAGAPADGHAFLVVDGWATLRADYEDLEPVVTAIATRGLSYGVHVVAAASRWLDFRAPIRDLFGSRVELRLGDPTDSLVSRRAALTVPEKVPGRGITADGRHLLTALPVLSALDSDPAALVRAVVAGWSGPPAPRVRLLPPVLPYTDLDVGSEGGLRLPIGIAEADLRPVDVDFGSDPHLLLFGDAECGKSSFLRALAVSITRRFRPEEARVILVDYRRSLLGAIDSDHLIGYGTTAATTAQLVDSVDGYMRRRLPGPDVTPQQLRDRSWWTGPELFVLVDDYDLVAAAPVNPLLPLVEHLAQARDVGLHLILTRRSGGASRALYEPVIQRLRELASPGLVMSGDPDEGALVGNVRPAPLPPGRARLVTRREGVRLVQLAYIPGIR
ncbi:type VII secretion protein EccCa [Phytohabitans houttuyneae]|uniref:Type VII secretion protein EccC n=1 Tax=Phytohabitans houttuyneae TaxID=1076126 RepID=A0A6V8K9J3_9ACTN|nr:type VII secretion protein EccCa [Phytohabitans houttuyneae]GFJ80150.1 type VII secretion protein EccC [Phytohabitans houttuyneae]